MWRKTCKAGISLLKLRCKGRSRNAGCSLAASHVAREFNGRTTASISLVYYDYLMHFFDEAETWLSLGWMIDLESSRDLSE